MDVATPRLLLDYGILRDNVSSVARLCGTLGVTVRPHFSCHRLAEVAAVQLKEGAVGISVTAIGDAWALAAAGVRRGLLITSELVGAGQLAAFRSLRRRGIEVWACVETAEGVEELASLDVGVDLLVQVDVGTSPTGARPEAVISLARAVRAAPQLRFRGLQIRLESASGIRRAEARREAVLGAWGRARDVVQALTAAGFAPEIVSGGTSSTFEFDIEAGVATELQLGDFAVGGLDGGMERPDTVRLPSGGTAPNPVCAWGHALRIETTVVSVRSNREVIVDAGLNAFSTSQPVAPRLLCAPRAHYSFDGDDYGRIRLSPECPSFSRGDKLHVVPSRYEPTTSLYNRVFAVSGDTDLGVWSVLKSQPIDDWRRREAVGPLHTKGLHAGYSPASSMGARGVPIYTTVGYQLRDLEHGQRLLTLQEDGFTYSRIHNPTVAVLEERLAAMEGGGSGVAVGSGAAAVSMALLNLCGCGDNIVATSTLYGGTSDLMRQTLSAFGINVRFVAVQDVGDIDRLIDDRTRCIFVESIGNPRLDIPDFARLKQAARDHAVPLLIDNTTATPALGRVRDLGGDVAVYSASKFLGGHGATIAGVVIDLGTFDWARLDNPFFSERDPSYGLAFGPHFGRSAYAARLRAKLLRNLGPTLGPFEAWCVVQGLETLCLRMERHCQNALAVARFLEAHPAVSWVSYPGLPSHASYARCTHWFGGLGGGMLFFGMRGGFDAAARVLSRVQLVSHITQFGDARTTIQHPASTSHSQVPAAEAAAAGVFPEMLRLSVGLEDLDDLLADLERAVSPEADGRVHSKQEREGA